MKSFRPIAALLLVFAGVAGFALAWTEYQELVKLRAEAAGDDRADLRKRLFDAQKRIKALQDQLAARQNRSGRAAAGRGGPDSQSASAGQPGRPDFRRAFGGLFQAVTNSPQFQKLAAIQQKAGLDARYAALFKSLVQDYGLNAQQIDQLKNLLVQKQQAAIAALQAARDQGLNPRTDPADFQQVVSDAQAGVDSQIQAALGTNVYSAYTQYEQTLPQRSLVNQLQQSLSYTSTPLSDDQASQLLQAVEAASAPSGGAAGTVAQNFRFMFSPNSPAPAAPVTTQTVAAAQALLSQPQVQALQQIQAQQQAEQQIQQLFQAGRRGGGVAANGTGG
jgi:hypothetical protein